MDTWGEEGIFSFPINIDRVLKHLWQDMKDDWFTDILYHKDLHKKSVLNDILIQLLHEGNGRYIAEESIICNIPKKGLGIRYSLETDYFDRFMYQALCSFLMPYYDPLLAHRVLSHRYNKYSKDNKYLFKNRIDLWKTFDGITYTAFEDNKVLLVTDLINYFENISISGVITTLEQDLDKVKATGKEKLKIRNAISTLSDLLTKWSYNQKTGLPQNRDCSSFLANIILNKVDQKMLEYKYDYYRYVDDIRIICDTPQQAKKILLDLISELRTVNMNINSAKTEIISKNDEVKIADFFPNLDDINIKIDNMWRSRSKRVITRSVPLIIEILNNCMQKKETQSRQFRFAINRLIMLIDTEIFDINSKVVKNLVKLIINSLEIQPVSTDQFCRLLICLNLTKKNLSSIAVFLCDENRAIHLWQNYHLWLLLARKCYKNEMLIQYAIKKSEDNPSSIESASIFIYLFCVEKSELLIPLIQKFDQSWPYINKRYFLMAIYKLDIDKEIKNNLITKLNTKIRKTGTRASSSFIDGLPFAEREKTSLDALYEYISPYD